MALIIAGERSGVGKTTVTLALLSFLCRQQQRVQSFKVGPDYIDPMFHQRVTERPGRNLDPVLTSERYVQECFNQHLRGVDYALVEGVMGLFDGASGQGDWASTAHLARLLQLPVLLVIDCSRLSRSVAAIAHGYRSFDPRIKLAGVVLNRVGSDRHLELLKNALEPLQLPILGVLRRQDKITIPARHLGLVPTAEINQLDTLIDRLAQLGKDCFNWEILEQHLKVGKLKAESSASQLQPSKPETPIRVAIARDRAFSFYYQDNLDILQQLGAQLVPWSPLTDAALPTGVQGLYFGGGFPEVFAQQLAANTSAREAVRRAILTGIPAYAECGGLMYLSEQIRDFEEHSWSMVGVLPTTTLMGKRLTLGYRQATTMQDSPLLPVAAKVWGHEFHRSEQTAIAEKPLFEIRGYDGGKVAMEGWKMYRLHASYVHLHWGESPEIPARFLTLCRQFGS
ncbi:cobyrinate a,c-diamide synthase [Lyngbya aestuarii]|uniref:cobyrinate a,c-diamide synthase n=1 Tax=Lyngbya aestuarii TaxID=118322 RepID=UPI00403E14F5